MESMQPDPEPKAEALAVAQRYARRKAGGSLYSILRPEVILSTQEWQRESLFMLGSVCGYTDADLRNLSLVDVGCGYGGHLLDFLRFGFAPHNLRGIELLPERAAAARTRLPELLSLHEGDATSAPIAPASQDVVFQSVVFSSLLDDTFQQELADRMWSWLRPGGGVLWYDFVYDNPSNPDVRAVPVGRVKALFPQGRMTVRRVTLAPPISRRACRIHPAAYHLFNLLPFLRTHVLCWIQKS
jgi:SAM-dependent methyltransferase